MAFANSKLHDDLSGLPHPSQDRTTRHDRDALMRSRGWSILSRPRGGRGDTDLWTNREGRVATRDEVLGQLKQAVVDAVNELGILDEGESEAA